MSLLRCLLIDNYSIQFEKRDRERERERERENETHIEIRGMRRYG